MRVTLDLGFPSLLLFALVCLVVPVIGFVVRRRWRHAEARAEDIRRLLVLAAEEAARAEIEASYQYGAVSVANSNLCALCFSPTTTRCARCKAVHYCSGKCQIAHWRQGHKDECRPPSTTHQTHDRVSDLGKKVAEPGYRGINDDKCQIESTEYTTSSKKPPLSDISSSSEISCAKDDNIRVEPIVEGNVKKSNSELSSNTFSGFSASASATASDSSDDSSVCESETLNEHERSEGHIFADPAHDISDTPSNGNSIGATIPLSPKFASLVDSVDGFSTMPKPKQVRPGFSEEEFKLTSNDTSGFMMRKGAMIEPSIGSSGFWNKALDSRGITDDSYVDLLASQSNESLPKSAGDNMASTRSAYSEKGVDSSGHSDASSIHNLQTAGSKISNHVTISSGSSLKSDEIRSRPHTFADTELVSRTEEHSQYSTKFGNNGIQSGTATPSQIASCSPNSKNGLKISVQKVGDQFRGSSLSKNIPQAVGSDIAGKYSDKGLFPYNLFVKLYNWNRVEFQPFGLINCGNSCYANAVLQCLAFTPPLTAYLLQRLHSKSCTNRKWCFVCDLESLILKAKDTKSPLSPKDILSQLQKNGSQLGNGREEDAHEFLRHVIETMQSVCLMESGPNMPDSLKEETNLTGLTFGGYLRSKIKCMKCGGKSERQERMLDLTVEIEGEIATLEEALRQFTSIETLDGENKYHCVRCKSYQKAKKKMTVSEAPNVLTIALKRFKSGKFGKLNKSIRFPEILDLAPFMSGTSDLAIYRLYGVVVHLDTMNAAFSGHYVCYVKNFQNRWFKVDDSVVTAVELETVLTKGAYMLLYARCSPRAPRLIRNMIVSSDPKSKAHAKTVAMKARNVSSDSGAAESMTGLVSPDGPHTLEKFLDMKRIFEEDSSSDNSSLMSSNSDEWSCSTDSTCDSTSTDDYADYIFGNSGRGLGGILRNSDSEVDGLLYRSRGVSHLHTDTIVEHRKLDTSRSSSSFRETGSLQRSGSNHFSDINSGVLYRKSKLRTD